jgi:hypothetical protein
MNIIIGVILFVIGYIALGWLICGRDKGIANADVFKKSF